jgi:plastocyanin
VKPTRTIARRTALLALLPALLLAGCGGDDSDSSSGGGKVPVTLSDFKIDPSTVPARGPGTLTLSVINNGPSSHALELEGNGVEEETETIGTGESATLSVELEAGTYELYCPIGNHRARGMESKIVVGQA